jgi:hypothetical protein
MEWHSDGSEGEFTMLMSLSGERERERERKRIGQLLLHPIYIRPDSDSHADLFPPNSAIFVSAKHLSHAQLTHPVPSHIIS